VKFTNIGFLPKRKNSVLFNHMQLRDCQSVIDLTDCAESTSLLQFFLMLLAWLEWGKRNVFHCNSLQTSSRRRRIKCPHPHSSNLVSLENPQSCH